MNPEPTPWESAEKKLEYQRLKGEGMDRGAVIKALRTTTR